MVKVVIGESPEKEELVQDFQDMFTATENFILDLCMMGMAHEFESDSCGNAVLAKMDVVRDILYGATSDLEKALGVRIEHGEADQ